MKVGGSCFFADLELPLSATAAIGAASATRAIVIRSRPRPPLPHRALERDSPPRFPVPHRALERLPLGASKFLRDIPSPFSALNAGRSADKDATYGASKLSGTYAAPGEGSSPVGVTNPVQRAAFPSIE